MTTSYLRKATKADLPAILEIIDAAKAYLKEQGINQWQAGYPTNQDIEKDIEQKISYVLMVDGEIAATASLWPDRDVNYDDMLEGSWRGNPEDTYMSIHRIAMSSKFRGQRLSEKMMSGLFTISSELGYNELRIDTHPKNKGMQKVIANNGFEYRGIIDFNDENEVDTTRFAYQLYLN
ncbi:GNAT family N-acetyltransferase [Pediococcus pentosaceus]|uniref:GNAT family N-acetyltransferase n=1 Tax=Pediococcus pentosaceus TaxID=1255 RepID=UPI003D806A43